MNRTASAGFVALVGALTTLPPLSIDVSLPGLPAIARALHAQPGALQWTLSLFVLAFGAGQLVLGPLADRYGRRPVLLGGIALFTVAGLGCALAGDAGALVALRFFQGLGACAGTVCARAIVEDVATSRARSASLQAYVTAFNNVAPLVAPLLGAAILALAGWRWLYGVLAVAGALLLLGIAFGIPETGPMVDDHALVAYRRVLRLPRTAGLAGVSFFSFAAYFALITGSPFVLIGQLHVAPGAFSVAFAINAEAALVGTFVTARLAKRVAPERILRGAVALAVAVGIATLAVDARAPSIGGFVTTFALYGFAFGTLVPVLYTAALAGVGADTGLTAGILGAAQSFGGALGSGTAGVLPWIASTSVGLVVAAAALACGVSYACSRSGAS